MLNTIRPLFSPVIASIHIIGCSKMLALICCYALGLTGALAYGNLNGIEIQARDLITFTTLGGLLLVYLIAGFCAYLCHHTQQIKQSSQAIKNGQYQQAPRTLHNDELSQTLNNLAQIAKEFDRLVRRVIQNADEANSAARSENVIVARSADSTSEQTTAISQIAAAIEQMSTSINHVSEQVKDTVETSRQTLQLSNSGNQSVNDTIRCIENISATVAEATSRVSQLEARSQEIGSIISVIEGIADQTNLLALNAAIEAARAGEHGRGFAVVADEVRQLAIRTRKATEEVGNIITNTQNESHGIIDSITSIDKRVAQGIEMSSRAQQSLSSIIEGAQQTADLMNITSTSITEQTYVCNDIAANIEKISRAADKNLSDAQEAKETASYLETLSQRVLQALPKLNGGTHDRRVRS